MDLDDVTGAGGVDRRLDRRVTRSVAAASGVGAVDVTRGLRLSAVRCGDRYQPQHR